MGKVSLIFPRFKYASGDFSLGLAYLSAYLKQEAKDVEVDLIDATFNPSLDYVSSALKESDPDIVGIYSDTLMFEDALKVAEIAREQGAYVVAGGPHPSIMPDSVIKNRNIDAICIGEGEQTFCEFVKEFFGNKNFSQVKGLWHKENGNVIKNSPREVFEELDNLPFPDVAIFDVERYIDNFIQLDSYDPKLRGMSVIVSRGCCFSCAYCQPTLTKIFSKRFKMRSPQNVVAELKELQAKYKLDAFYFQDDTLTISKKWINEFCDRIIQEGLDIFWACNTRADTCDEAMLTKMKQAGLVKIKVGIESYSDRIRNDIYRKNIKRNQIDQLITVAKKLDIQVTGFFMLGAPTETSKEIWQTIKYAARSDLKEANFSITVLLPMTSLYDTARENGWSLPKKLGEYDYYHASRPPITSSDVSSKKLELFKKMAYLYFYLHPKRMFNTFKIVWGIDGFKKTVQKLKRF